MHWTKNVNKEILEEKLSAIDRVVSSIANQEDKDNFNLNLNKMLRFTAEDKLSSNIEVNLITQEYRKQEKVKILKKCL